MPTSWTILFICLILSPSYGLCQQQITAGEIVKRIQQETQIQWMKRTVDTYKSGDSTTRITGIATTFLPTLDILKEAHDKGLNLIITHEPTYYNHLDQTEHLENDPVFNAKRKFIEEHNLVIWRFHDHIHRMEPDGIYKGIVDFLGWTEQRKKEFIYSVEFASLKDLASFLKSKFNAQTIRVIGNPEMPVSHVALSLGSPGFDTHMKRANMNEVDVLIAGETREWEGVPYIQDAISQGRNKAMIILGHATSEDQGMAYCADWLKSFISEIPVEFIPTPEPFWSPE